MKNILELDKEESLRDKRTNIITTGLDMSCNKVLATGELYYHKNRWCLHTDGIDMYIDDISDLFLDTKENRKELMIKL